MGSYDYTGRVVLVTGAASGIGRGVAEAYARSRARVILADQNTKDGEQAVRELQVAGWDASFMQTDVSRPEEIVGLMKTVRKQYGRLDVLINNAGISRWKSPYELTVEEWDEILNSNLRGVFLCAREAAKVMRENGGGSIVNIASTRAFMSEPDSEAYAAAKGGIVALTHALAISFAPDGIQVNAISPGWIETGDYTALRRQDHEQHPSGRVGRPDDVARACLYITDEDNRFLNGENIILDGGMTRKMIYES